MHELIMTTLAQQEIPYFFVKRQSEVFPCVVFQYNEQPLSMSDNAEELTLYDCYFNICCKGNITDNINKVREVLEQAGFQKVVINAPQMFDGDDFYQITMNYTRWFSIA